MSEEPDVPLTNLEDDTPPAPEAVTPPAAPPEPEPAPVEAVEVAGQKYVPLAAVIEERKQRQALQERAGRADQLEQYVNENRAYIDFLQQNPDFLKRPAAPEPVPQQPQVDEKALRLAQRLDLYTSEGKPDVQKAQEIRELFREEAQAISQQAVQPLQQQTLQQQAAANYQRVLNVTDPLGNKPNPQAVNAIFQQLLADPKGLASAADPRMAPILALWAMGATHMATQPVAPPPAAPLITEASGGMNPSTPVVISKAEETILRNRGMSAAKYQELTKGFTPGKATVLED